jgi:Zn-dependent peptidase ImmA (M78 family)
MITYDALDQYAEAVIRDAQPSALDAPVPIDVEKFIEFYLGLAIEFKSVSYDRQILGMTAFNDGTIYVISEQTGKRVPIQVSGGTVFVEPLLTEKRNAARRRFTVMHEGAHWLIHRPAFAEDNPFGTPGMYDNQYLAAKEGRIDYSRCQKERNDHERIERQADFLASALLMPKSTLRMAFVEFFKFYGEKPRALVRGKDNMDENLAEMLPEYVAKQFNVSKRAALIRLEKLNAIVGRPSVRFSYAPKAFETYV